MQVAIDETERRRAIQMEYNEEHGITPRTVLKSREKIMEQTSVADVNRKKDSKQRKMYAGPDEGASSLAADPVIAYMKADQLAKLVKETQRKMEKAAKELDFMEAARLRDELMELQKLQKEKGEAQKTKV
jgi:excinuclease ABC subunit B